MEGTISVVARCTKRFLVGRISNRNSRFPITGLSSRRNHGKLVVSLCRRAIFLFCIRIMYKASLQSSSIRLQVLPHWRLYGMRLPAWSQDFVRSIGTKPCLLASTSSCYQAIGCKDHLVRQLFSLLNCTFGWRRPQSQYFDFNPGMILSPIRPRSEN